MFSCSGDTATSCLAGPAAPGPSPLTLTALRLYYGLDAAPTPPAAPLLRSRCRFSENDTKLTLTHTLVSKHERIYICRYFERNLIYESLATRFLNIRIS